jgi:hypothetical protein
VKFQLVEQSRSFLPNGVIVGFLWKKSVEVAVYSFSWGYDCYWFLVRKQGWIGFVRLAGSSSRVAFSKEQTAQQERKEGSNRGASDANTGCCWGRHPT